MQATPHESTIADISAEDVISYNRKHDPGFPAEGQACIVCVNHRVAFRARFFNNIFDGEFHYLEENGEPWEMECGSILGWMPA